MAVVVAAVAVSSDVSPAIGLRISARHQEHGLLAPEKNRNRLRQWVAALSIRRRSVRVRARWRVLALLRGRRRRGLLSQVVLLVVFALSTVATFSAFVALAPFLLLLVLLDDLLRVLPTSGDTSGVSLSALFARFMLLLRDVMVLTGIPILPRFDRCVR